jgi:hypothetical protein
MPVGVQLVEVPTSKFEPAAIQVKFVCDALPVPWPKAAVVAKAPHRAITNSMSLVFINIMVVVVSAEQDVCADGFLRVVFGFIG